MSAPAAVHPVADLFPVLAGEELAELAEDIRQRGLLHPVVLDREGRVLDGRSRLAACELAGVAPTFASYEGDDPAGYAAGVNLARRHLTKSQRAMLAAKILLLSNNGQAQAAETVGVSQPLISQANAVLRHAPDISPSVLAGDMPLGDAYKVARERKQEAERAAVAMERLARDAPDLAAAVREERLSLDHALRDCDERQERARRERAERERREHEESVRAARSAAAAREQAKTIVTDLSAAVSTIIAGLRDGATDLVTADMVRDLRQSVDRLERVIG